VRQRAGAIYSTSALVGLMEAAVVKTLEDHGRRFRPRINQVYLRDPFPQFLTTKIMMP
jgi:hypothetical protein